jgi:hypothetical protein
MEGDVEVRDRPAEADISAADIFSNLSIGFMGYLDANEEDTLVELDSTLSLAKAQALVRVAPTVELYGGLRDTGGRYALPARPVRGR